MERKKIVYGGICCRVNPKAEFVRWGIKSDDSIGRMFVSALMDLEKSAEVFELVSMERGKMKLKAELTDEICEHLFKVVVAPNLLQMQKKEMSYEHEFLLEPVLCMDHEEIKIDIVPFLAYALIKNARCRQMFEEQIKGNTEEYYRAFKQSKYAEVPFLSWFLMEERQMVKLAIGFIVQMQEESENGEKYRMLLEMLCGGFRSVKNMIKKLKRLDGNAFRDAFGENEEMAMSLSRMIIQMVLAEELGIPIEYDYDVCLVLLQLQRYENAWLVEDVKPEATSEGMMLYKKFKKEHPLLYSYYDCTLQEKVEEYDEWCNQILQLFDLNLQMLENAHLEKKECEVLASLRKEMKWEEYKKFLLIANLCKYISQMQEIYEKNIPDEIIYQQWEKEQKTEEFRGENQQLEQKIQQLMKVNQNQEKVVEELSVQKEKLENRIQKMEEEAKLERKELIGLRNFVFQLGEETEEFCETVKEESAYHVQDEKIIVVGGHENWQRKMKKYLPASYFLVPGNHNVDTSVIANKKYIIFNTDVLDHALYYKIMSQRKEEQKIMYVHGCNVDKTLQQIGRQM